VAGRWARRALVLLTASELLLAACSNATSSSTTTNPPGASAAPSTTSPKPAATPVSCPAASSSSAAAPSSVAPPTTNPPITGEGITNAPLTHIDIPPLKSQGRTLGSDLMEVDQQAHLLYVTDRTDNGIEVFDISSPEAKYVRTISVCAGPNGITVAKGVNKVYVGLSDSSVAVIDIDPSSPTANQLIGLVPTGGAKRADELDFDSQEKKLYVANSDDGFVSVIDATSDKIIKKIGNLGGGLEQPRYNSGDGTVYLTGVDDNVLYAFDPTTDQQVKKIDLGMPCGPTGLGINSRNNEALIACIQPHVLLVDLRAGKVMMSFDQVGGADGLFYSENANRYFVAAVGWSKGPVIGILGGSPVKFITNVPTGTARAAHGVAFDETHNIVYTQDGDGGGIQSFPAPS
jgi:YVTN family beta-propeller protein